MRKSLETFKRSIVPLNNKKTIILGKNLYIEENSCRYGEVQSVGFELMKKYLIKYT